MSSTSYVRLRTPSSYYCTGRAKSAKRDESNVLSAIMWTVGSLLVSFNVDMKNTTGITVSASLTNVLLMLLTTLLLGKGLKDGNPKLAVPWLLVSCWSMYSMQLMDINKIYRTLQRFHNVMLIPWLSLGAYTISLIIRFHLTLCVAYVSMQQWFNKKLELEVESS